MKLITAVCCALMLVANVGMAKGKKANWEKWDRRVASANEPFSAFIHNNVLYVTVMGDCNKIGGGIQVEKACDKNREERNKATTCEAELVLHSNKKGCPGHKSSPQIVVINLADTQLAPEATELELTYAGKELDLEINKETVAAQ